MVCAPKRECRLRLSDILLHGQIYDVRSANIIFKWFKTTSQFRHQVPKRSLAAESRFCAAKLLDGGHRLTIFFDAKYNILRRLSSLTKLGLFLVTWRNWRPKSFYNIRRIYYFTNLDWAVRFALLHCSPMHPDMQKTLIKYPGTSPHVNAKRLGGTTLPSSLHSWDIICPIFP